MYAALSSTSGDSDPSDCEIYEDGRLFIAWKGFVFHEGRRAGTDTIAHLARRLAHEPLAALCQSLHGIFVLFVFDKDTAIWRVAVDNAGLYHAFHDAHGVGTSFLEILAKSGTAQLSAAAAAEFLAHDGVYWSRTLVDGIVRISHAEIVQLEPADGATPARRTVVEKALPDARPGDPAGLLGHSANLAGALAGRRVSLDLTGGIDSRLVACLMSLHGVAFETAAVGRPGHPDLRIAARAADVLGVAFHPTIHDSSGIEDELEELFRQCDGLGDVLTYHRSRQLSLDRRRRGVDLVITGAGGELYKDFWWLQDWPFYASPKSNFERLYDLRVHPIGLPAGYLTGAAAAAYADLRRRTVERFAGLRAATNTESYDRIYFFYKMTQFVGRFATSNINHHLAVSAPLLDYDNFLLAKALPVGRRAFNRFHRSFLSEHCPALARLATTEGVSARAGRGPPIIDPLAYGMNRLRRLSKKVAERTLGRRWMRLPEPSDPGTAGRARRSAAFRQALEALKDVGIINGDLRLEAVRDSDVGRLLTLGLLVRRLPRSGPAR